MGHLGNVKYKNRNRGDVYPNAERGGMGTPVIWRVIPTTWRRNKNSRDNSKFASNVGGNKVDWIDSTVEFLSKDVRYYSLKRMYKLTDSQ